MSACVVNVKERSRGGRICYKVDIAVNNLNKSVSDGVRRLGGCNCKKAVDNRCTGCKAYVEVLKDYGEVYAFAAQDENLTKGALFARSVPFFIVTVLG